MTLFAPTSRILHAAFPHVLFTDCFDKDKPVLHSSSTEKAA